MPVKFWMATTKAKKRAERDLAESSTSLAKFLHRPESGSQVRRQLNKKPAFAGMSFNWFFAYFYARSGLSTAYLLLTSKTVIFLGLGACFTGLIRRKEQRILHKNAANNFVRKWGAVQRRWFVIAESIEEFWRACYNTSFISLHA